MFRRPPRRPVRRTDFLRFQSHEQTTTSPKLLLNPKCVATGSSWKWGQWGRGPEEVSDPRSGSYQSSTTEQDHEDDEGLEPVVLHDQVAGLPQEPPVLAPAVGDGHVAALVLGDAFWLSGKQNRYDEPYWSQRYLQTGLFWPHCGQQGPEMC